MFKDLWNIFIESSKSFEGQEKGEQVMLLARQHPFVALSRLTILSVFAVLPILIYFALYGYIMSSEYFGLFLYFISLYYLVIWLVAFYFLMVYTLNVVIVTDRRVIDRHQKGFFDRKVSELHIYRVQDITVSTKGVIPTLLHYGNVEVQTAASEKEFIFYDLPHPEEVKNTIMKVVSMANSGVKPIDSTLSAS